jgi:hypothetical protein
MLRELLADFALWRSRRLVAASEWWTDVAEWVTTPHSWREIRASRSRWEGM